MSELTRRNLLGTAAAAADAAPLVIVVVIAHDKSPWTLDWVSTGLIGRGQGLFPEICDMQSRFAVPVNGTALF